MRTAIVYDPYLETLGGGERYALTLSAVLAERFEVTLAAPTLPSLKRWKAVGLYPTGPTVMVNDRQFTQRSADFNVAVVIANRLPPPTHAERSFVVVQFPFPGSLVRHPRRVLERHALLARYHAIAYSEFVRQWCVRRWQMTPTVIPPPIAPPRATVPPGFIGQSKQHTILAVGRFFAGGHNKRHDVLIDAFRRLSTRSDIIPARLVLAGVAHKDPASRGYIEQLKKQATGLNIEFFFDVSPPELDRLYREAILFWHATGYGRSLRHPERAEHFGMTTVEAMSYGLVPLVYDDGGPREVVITNCGVRWRSIDELVEGTTTFLRNPQHRTAIARNARQRSAHFSFEHFEQAIIGLLDGPTGTFPTYTLGGPFAAKGGGCNQPVTMGTQRLRL